MIILILILAFGIIKFTIPWASQHFFSGENPENVASLIHPNEKQTHLTNFINYLNSPENPNRDHQNRTSIKAYKYSANTVGSYYFNEIDFNQEIVDQLSCSLKESKIVC